MIDRNRTWAAATLLSLDPPHWHLRHARAVAEIAAWLAARAEARGLPVDRATVEAAALLHDVDKLLKGADPAGDLPHGEGSAAWLASRGRPDLAAAVASHPVTRLGGPDAIAWLRYASLEELIVAYADKRAGQRLEPMARRFSDWARRYPESEGAPWAIEARRRAERLERDVCERLAIDPSDVRRLRWTGRALRRAAGDRAVAA